MLEVLRCLQRSRDMVTIVQQYCYELQLLATKDRRGVEGFDIV